MRQALCSLADVQNGETKSFQLNQNSYIVSHKNQQIYVYLNRCPHLGIPLEWEENQFIDDDTQLIRCASHGALFIHESGECVAGPCYGASLKKIDYQIEGEQIFLLK